MADITRPAPRCPECGGMRFWYGKVEYWLTSISHGSGEHLNLAVCSNCGYSSAYLQNMEKFRQDLTRMGLNPPAPQPANTSGIDPRTGMPISSGYDSQVGMPASANNQPAFMPQEPPEMAAIRAALRAGDKIKAIKLYRGLYGGSLQDAQEALGRMQAR